MPGSGEDEAPGEAEALPAVVPVDIDRHWRAMDGAELAAMAARIGPRRGSVYSWELRERVADGRQKTLPGGELGDHLRIRLAHIIGEDRLAELGLTSTDAPASTASDAALAQNAAALAQDAAALAQDASGQDALSPTVREPQSADSHLEPDAGPAVTAAGASGVDPAHARAASGADVGAPGAPAAPGTGAPATPATPATPGAPAAHQVPVRNSEDQAHDPTPSTTAAPTTPGPGGESEGPDSASAPSAWDLIDRAGKLIREDRPAEAALAADEAMRTAGDEDPLGVRIAALDILAYTSMNTGFLGEGVAYARQAINLSAAAGFDLAAAEFAGMLATQLSNLRRHLETAEVAQLGIGYLEDRASASPLLELLLERMLDGLNGIKDERGAADIAIRLGDLRELAGDERAACLHHWEAARLLRSSDNYARALATWAHVARLAEATGDAALLTGALWNQADTLAFSPGRVSEEEYAQLEALLERLHGLGIDAVGPAPSGRPEDEAGWNALRSEAEWRRRAARLHWAAERHRAAQDVQEAAVESLERLGAESEVDYIEQLLVLANMYRMDGAIETALDRAAAAGRLLAHDSFEGHRLRGMHRNLMRFFEDDEGGETTQGSE